MAVKEAARNSILCDASSLISLTDAGLIGAMIMTRQRMRDGLYITPTVENEAINGPMKSEEYMFSAVRLKRALLEGVFRIVYPSAGTTSRILELSNSIFSVGGRPLRLVHSGEAEMLAAAIDNGIPNILMDERTTRTLLEAPNELRRHLTNEFRTSVSIDNAALAELSSLTAGLAIIRSAEIVAIAYEKGYFRKFKGLEKKAFEAALYAIKFKGCSIGFEEINELLREER